MQWKGEVPEHDVDDNPNAVASVPTAPPLEKMDTVAGYGNVGFDSGNYTERHSLYITGLDKQKMSA